MIVNPKAFSWVDPTDASSVADGITGYTVGIRNTTALGSVAGVYTTTLTASGAAAVSALLSAISPTLPAGVYAAAVQTNSSLAGASAWSAEIEFQITAPPAAPTGFSAA